MPAKEPAKDFLATGAIPSHPDRQFAYPEDYPLKPVLSASDPRWVAEQTECKTCSAAFGWTVRPHHCRACGHPVCGGCSQTQLWLDNSSGPLRVCTQCVSEIQHDPKRLLLALGPTARWVQTRQEEPSCGDASGWPWHDDSSQPTPTQPMLVYKIQYQKGYIRNSIYRVVLINPSSASLVVPVATDCPTLETAARVVTICHHVTARTSLSPLDFYAEVVTGQLSFIPSSAPL